MSRSIDLWSGRIVFWLLVLFVLVGFFQVLGLNQVTQPLLGLLNELFSYAPRLLAPVALIVVAWVVAKVLQLVVHRVLTAARMDERLHSEADIEAETRLPVARTLADAVFWITIVLFLPAVLHSLNIGGLLEPVRTMIDVVLAYLPNLIAAAIIFFVGWLIARILRRITTNVLAAIGTDRLSERVGVKSAIGEQSLSSLIGLVVYVLVLVPVLVAGLNALKLEAVTAPASRMLNAFLEAVPMIFAAGVLLVIAYIIGRVIAGFVQSLLRGIGFDSVPERLGLNPLTGEGRASLSRVAGDVTFAAILLFAAIEALRLIGFDAVADLGATFLVFAANILVGVAIVGIGLWLARIAARAIEASAVPQARLIAIAARASIIVLATAMGLGQMGLAKEIIFIAFGILFGAVARAAAIAFGIGSRDTAGRLAEDWVGSLGASKGRRPSATPAE